jgi:hypothetical protein
VLVAELVFKPVIVCKFEHPLNILNILVMLDVFWRFTSFKELHLKNKLLAVVHDVKFSDILSSFGQS